MVMLGAAVVVPPTAGAAPAQPDDQSPRLELLSQMPWVRPGEALQLSIRAEDAPSDAVVSLLVHEQVDSRGQLADTFGEEPELGDEIAAPTAQLLAALPPAADGGVELSLPIGEGGVALEDEGVYPVTVILSDSTGTVLARLVTYLLLLPAERGVYPPLDVSVLVEMGAPPALQPDGSIALDDDDLERFEDRTEVLTNTGNVALSVAPVPETLDAIGDDGAEGLELLQALQIGLYGHEVLARPYVNLDVTALRAANLLTEVPPVAEAGAQVIRTRFNTQPVGGIWITGPTVGQEDIDAVRDPVFQQPAERAVVPQEAIAGVPDDDLAEGPAPTAPVALAEGGPLAMVVDEALSDRLTGSEGQLDAQRFLAELMVMWLTRPSVERGVVARIAANSDIDPELVTSALQGLAFNNGDALRPVPLSRMFEEVEPLGSTDRPTVVDLAPDQSSREDLSSLAAPLLEARVEMPALALTLTDNAEFARLNRSLLVALGADTPDDERQDYINRVDDYVADVSDAIRAAPITITLTAREGTIPLTIVNESPRAVSVRVTLTSSQLVFPDGNQLDLTVEPGQRREDIRVRTRTSGAFSLKVLLTSPNGAVVLDQATITVRSTTVSGVGLLLSGGAGLFLLLWWARHWRRTRRARRLIGSHAAGAGADGRHPPDPPDPPPAPHIDPSRPGPATVARHAGSHRHRLVE
jgi:hypothetical protein